MTSAWPQHTLDGRKFDDVFQLAQTFELHCAKVYDHALNHPDCAPSADYVMQLVSQAYRAVHSLHMQKTATEYLDMGTATAALEKNAKEYHERCELSSVDDNEPAEAETADEPVPTAPSVGLMDILTEDFGEDDEEDSEWEESDEDTDDEYYEYCEGSDSDSEMEELAELSKIELAKPLERAKQAGDAQTKVLTKIPERQTTAIGATNPPISIFKDQAMHDRITAALRNMSLPPDEPEETTLEKVETHIDSPKTDSTACPTEEPEQAPLVQVETHIDHPKMDTTAYSTDEPEEAPLTDSTACSTDDAHSEATAVQTKSHQQTVLQHSITAPAANTRKASLDSTHFQRKLSMRSSASGLSRKFKTVCYKYAGRVMVPIRGKAN
ncbi:unnamed protein product [Penicillium bialowiezense]